jgi:hypothetical protein
MEVTGGSKGNELFREVIPAIGMRLNKHDPANKDCIGVLC